MLPRPLPRRRSTPIVTVRLVYFDVLGGERHRKRDVAGRLPDPRLVSDLGSEPTMTRRSGRTAGVEARSHFVHERGGAS
jgi:hypothetical protein